MNSPSGDSNGRLPIRYRATSVAAEERARTVPFTARTGFRQGGFHTDDEGPRFEVVRLAGPLQYPSSVARSYQHDV